MLTRLRDLIPATDYPDAAKRRSVVGWVERCCASGGPPIATARVLGLEDREYTEFRLVWLEIVGPAAREDPELYSKLMGFPTDRPNVARLHPPGGNKRPEGIEQSYFAQKKKANLPDTY